MADGVLRGIARHEAPRAPMEALESAELVVGAGLQGDARGEGDRPIVIVSEEGWQAALQELGHSVEWLTRRGNLLVSGVDLPSSVGKRLEIGGTVLEIAGEVAPCGLMDKFQAGLRKALEPEMRAGVWGRIITGGTIRIGDGVRVVPSHRRP
jgi:MOSC domain-containing protein YiiM